MCPDWYNQTTPACQAFLMPPHLTWFRHTQHLLRGFCYLSFGLSTEAVAFFHSPVLPFFPPCLLLLSRLISIEETLSARLSKLENYGFDQLVSQPNWYHLLKEKSGFWGTPFVPTGRSRPDIRGMRGRGGKSYVWRLFPWRISTFSAPW